MSHETILLIDDETAIAEGLAAYLDDGERTIVVCSDIESAEILVENLEFSSIVSDIRLSGPFRHEGLDFVGHALTEQPGCRVILMTGVHSEELREEASRRGAAAFLEKPFDSIDLERLLQGGSRAA
ncbi:MAG: response regulator [Thermoanaerobaculia bacterium]